MVDGTRFRIPSPGIPGAVTVPQAAQVQVPQFQINFPPPKPPIVINVINTAAIRSKATSEIAWWPLPRPLSLRIVNSLDAAVRVRVYVSNQQSTTNPSAEPVLEFEVGPGQNKPMPIDPAFGIPWAQWVWVEVEPLTTVLKGTLTAEIAREGSL